MKTIISIIFSISICFLGNAQSFEVMPGTKRVFIDTQYLRFLNSKKELSLFSRARATTEYDGENTNLLIGGYLNYTTNSGFGGTVIGRISTNSSGFDTGIHYFKAKKSFMIYAIPHINIGDELFYSWFSIMRFTPNLKKKWKLYSSIELFSLFGKDGHLNSVQRVRLGVDKKGYQFGLAVNLDKTRSLEIDINSGIFFRKQF